MQAKSSGMAINYSLVSFTELPPSLLLAVIVYRCVLIHLWRNVSQTIDIQPLRFNASVPINADFPMSTTNEQIYYYMILFRLL